MRCFLIHLSLVLLCSSCTRFVVLEDDQGSSTSDIIINQDQKLSDHQFDSTVDSQRDQTNDANQDRHSDIIDDVIIDQSIDIFPLVDMTIDTTVDTLSPDATIDTTVDTLSPDATIDTTVDTLSPDATIDTTVDTLSPDATIDTTVDTVSPDATVDTTVDTTVDLPCSPLCSGTPSVPACCLDSCTLAPLNTSCRAPSNECDAEEVCDGVSADCPVDLDQPNGTSCSTGVCQNGSCVIASCRPADANTVAYYPMDSSSTTSLLDSVGGHDASLQSGLISRVAVSGCGQALVCNGSTYLMIAPDNQWNISTGSLEFRLRVNAPTSTYQGIIARDESGAGPGQFTILYSAGGRLVIRFQTSGSNYYMCSNVALPTDQWMDIAINFGTGGQELYIDGTQQIGTGTIQLETFWTINCNTPGSSGIDGNSLEWAICAYPGRSASMGSVSEYFTGQIDDFRISKIRRSF